MPSPSPSGAVVPDRVVRLREANAVLRLMGSRTQLEDGPGGLAAVWTGPGGKPRRARWVPRSRGSDYPSCSDRLPHGGTMTVATMELTRWVRGIPIRPLGTWERWCGPQVGMKPAVLDAVRAMGWPAQVPCVFCGRLLGAGVPWDHFDHRKYPVGPGCWYTEGCRGEPPPA